MSPPRFKKGNASWPREFIPGIWVQFNIRKSIGVIHHMDRLKKKSHTTLSIDAEKSFNKIWYPSMINILSKLVGVGGNFFRAIKVIDKNSTANITHINERLTAFPLDQEKDKGIYCLQSYSASHRISHFLP